MRVERVQAQLALCVHRGSGVSLWDLVRVHSSPSMFGLGFRTSQSVGAFAYSRVEIDSHLTGGSDSRQKLPTARAARADRQLLSYSVSLRRVTVVPRRVASLLSDLEPSRCLTEFQEAVVQKFCARYAWGFVFIQK